MKFIIATNNNKKLEELQRILAPLGITAVTAKSEGVSLDEVDETGQTFAENAFLKANAAFKKTGLPSIADDSGLCVDALGGRPGVFTARYGGEGLTSEQRYLKLLDEMKNVPEGERTARFVCSICCILPDGGKMTCEGSCTGSIAFEPCGNGGFGYDPVFLYEGKSFALFNAEQKDAVSHRGKALRKLKAELTHRKAELTHRRDRGLC